MKRVSLVFLILVLVLSACAHQRVEHYPHGDDVYFVEYLVRLLRSNGYDGFAVRRCIWKNDEVNAYISDTEPPVVTVTTGLLDKLTFEQNKDILAAVIAHELAHWKLKHIQKKKAVSYTTSAVLTVAGLFIPGVGLTDLVVNPTITSAFSRDQELEADRESVEMLRRAGWKDPESIVIRALQWGETVHPPEGRGLWASHPPAKDRIENIREAYPAQP